MQADLILFALYRCSSSSRWRCAIGCRLGSVCLWFGCRGRCRLGFSWGCRGQLFDSGGKGNKNYEFQLQAAGTRFSLIYSAAGRYGASQIHSYFRQRYNFFINLQFFQIFLINQPYCLHKTVISMWLLVKLCQFVSQ